MKGPSSICDNKPCLPNTSHHVCCLYLRRKTASVDVCVTKGGGMKRGGQRKCFGAQIVCMCVYMCVWAKENVWKCDVVCVCVHLTLFCVCPDQFPFCSGVPPQQCCHTEWFCDILHKDSWLYRMHSRPLDPHWYKQREKSFPCKSQQNSFLFC